MNVFSNFSGKVNLFLVTCPFKRLVLFIMIIQTAFSLSKEGETSFGDVISSQVVASERHLQISS